LRSGARTRAWTPGVDDSNQVGRVDCSIAVDIRVTNRRRRWTRSPVIDDRKQIDYIFHAITAREWGDIGGTRDELFNFERALINSIQDNPIIEIKIRSSFCRVRIPVQIVLVGGYHA
jgi:hypothetical protein